MKKVLSALLFLLLYSFMQAQTKEQQLKNIIADSNKQAKTFIRTVNDLKSGNWQDVLASFFQLGFKDLTSTNKSLEFKANLLALKAKADSTILVDTNYVQQRFSRDFQFNFALKLDSQYHFTGLKAGFTLALINKRDSSVMSLLKTPADAYFRSGMDSLEFIFARFSHSLRKPGNLFKSEADSLLFLKTKNAVDVMLEAGNFQSKLLPKEFLKFASLQIVERDFRIFDSLFNVELSKLRKRPLLTLTIDGTFNDHPGLFSEGTSQLVFLQGLTNKGRNLELDLRANFAIIDTIVNNIRNRIEFGLTGGCNWAIITASKNINKSLVEIKPHFEYKRVTRCLYPGEEKEKISANAELRVRVTDNLWIPLSLKYDLKENNFLGFLNVSLNLDAFKKALK